MAEEPLLTGKRFRAIFAVAGDRLAENKDAVNALNVFPVPDGDTGTNMCLTVASAIREMEKVSSSSLGEMVKALALGSLMGARGNSGVILSQLFRGLSKSLQEHRSATSLQFAWAMQEGVETAYKAVMKPVEGTILTVAREMARAALQSAKRGAMLVEVLDVAVVRGREVLARTPDMLPVLKQAGVVDAGGMGLLCLIEGALQGLRGESAARPGTRGMRSGLAVEVQPQATADEILFTYDTQVLIKGPRLAVDRIRAQLEPLGDSLLVVGDPSVVKVHVHTNEPHRAISICLEHGDLIEASVENMREQHKAVEESRMALASPAKAAEPRQGVESSVGEPRGAETRGGAPRAAAPPLAFPSEAVRQLANLPEVEVPAPDGPGVVVVASGAGLEEIFRNLGADAVVSGGQTMNPSTEDLLKAVETIPHREVIILPNNGNIQMAAKQTIELASKAVRVVPTRSIPQGLAALVALNRAWSAEKNQKRMEEALSRVKSGEVTCAVRDSNYKEFTIHSGDFIGLFEDEIVTVGPDAMSVLVDLVGKMANGETEIITVFCGADLDEADVARTLKRLSECSDGHSVEVHRGGQPLYHYLVSVE